MSEVIDLKKKYYWYSCNFHANLCKLQFFANTFVRTVLTDLLDTSCQ